MAARRVSQSQFSLLIIQLKSKGYEIKSKERRPTFMEYTLISPNGMTRKVRYTCNGWLQYD